MRLAVDALKALRRRPAMPTSRRRRSSRSAGSAAQMACPICRSALGAPRAGAPGGAVEGTDGARASRGRGRAAASGPPRPTPTRGVARPGDRRRSARSPPDEGDGADAAIDALLGAAAPMPDRRDRRPSPRLAQLPVPAHSATSAAACATPIPPCGARRSRRWRASAVPRRPALLERGARTTLTPGVRETAVLGDRSRLGTRRADDDRGAGAHRSVQGACGARRPRRAAACGGPAAVGLRGPRWPSMPTVLASSPSAVWLVRDLVHERTGLYYDERPVRSDGRSARAARGRARASTSFLDYYYLLKYDAHGAARNGTA